MKGRFGVVLLLVASMAACGGTDEAFKKGFEEGKSSGHPKGQEEISQSDMGEEWPLTVSSGILKCEEPKENELNVQIVTFEAEGKIYAVNGIAKGREAGEDIDPIWADNPNIPGAKKDIGPLISRGRALCG